MKNPWIVLHFIPELFYAIISAFTITAEENKETEGR